MSADGGLVSWRKKIRRMSPWSIRMDIEEDPRGCLGCRRCQVSFKIEWEYGKTVSSLRGKGV